MPRLLPISYKAKKILEERMMGENKVKIERRVGNKVLFSSFNGNYWGWIDLIKDPDWGIAIKP